VATSSCRIRPVNYETDGVSVIEISDSWMYSAAVLLGLILLVGGWKLAALVTPGFGMDPVLALSSTVTVAIFVLSILVHEMIHTVTLLTIGGCRWADVRLGISWRSLTPYVSWSGPIALRHYQASVLAPFLAMGLVPFVLGCWFNAPVVVAWAVLMISAAAGDLVLFSRTVGLPGQSVVWDNQKMLGFSAILPTPE